MPVHGEEVTMPFDLLSVAIFLAVFLPALFWFVALAERQFRADEASGPAHPLPLR